MNRDYLLEKYRAVYAACQAKGLPLEGSIIQCVLGIAHLETRFGDAWQGAGVGSNNWGAIQSNTGPCDPTKSFPYTDTSPQPDGSSKPYSVCFRRYDTPALGAADLVDVMLVRRPKVMAAAVDGNVWNVSAEMYASRYYEGFGKTPAERVYNHWRTFSALCVTHAQVLGIQLPNGRPTIETLKQGSQGPSVRAWREFLTLPSGDQFDAQAHGATVTWQRQQGLTADGIVGPVTLAWAFLRTGQVVEPAWPVGMFPEIEAPTALEKPSKEDPQTKAALLSWYEARQAVVTAELRARIEAL